jgi:hypothetical protein
MGLSEKRRFHPDKPVGEPVEVSFGCSCQSLPASAWAEPGWKAWTSSPSSEIFRDRHYSAQVLRRFLELVKQSTWAAHDVVACIDMQDFAGDTAAISTQQIST